MNLHFASPLITPLQVVSSLGPPRISLLVPKRYSSSKRWQARQSKDKYSREAAINDRYKIFQPGQSVVDLGYAPGSWSQVAVDLTRPNGRVLGVDIIPAQPPKGVSTIQGNFLSPQIQAYVQEFLRDPNRGRPRYEASEVPPPESSTQKDPNKHQSEHCEMVTQNGDTSFAVLEEKTVDVVLSDMSAPWDQTSGFYKRSLSDPYHRMMNTSGINFRDHAGSMDLCRAALEFSFNVLKTGGHFVCKFYQGAEDKDFENQLKELFDKVHREKPDSSRSESKEGFFIALKRKPNIPRKAVLGAD
ncbi:hypothetical protein AJ80_07228 [Polytolypa hystricis UAMH7299]|uniref:rRNA methyltransferase 2, mitochondrial n=1 Tax=Polytolypa hystricis (strain UAMH7299) TaxID=1447883 RepID=A0A2B7XR35_POLH7|nr:hypothetical protein AJ80_07228 [Polytolypa hystricis UAMH7299]